MYCRAEWWKTILKKHGPNVCVQEQVMGENRYFAQPWADGNICGKQTVIKLRCCEGYAKVRGENGCSLVKPLMNLMDTAESFGAKKYANFSKLSGLYPLLSKRGAFTIFAPIDQAFLRLPSNIQSMINPTERSHDPSSILQYTIVNNRMYQEDLSSRTKVLTMYRDGFLRIIKYPNDAITINCVPLAATNLEATNGIVHLTESLLIPPLYPTVLDMLLKEPTLSTFASTVIRVQLTQLRSEGPFTIFAPIDEAWESLPQAFTEVLMDNSESLKMLVQYHIVKDAWCASMTAHESEISTLEGSNIRVTCNQSDIYLNDANLLQRDYVVGNGVVHFIDKVLLPDRVRFLNDVAASLGLTSFLRLASVTGFASALSREGSYTFFAPTDEAFNALPNDLWDHLISDPSFGRHVIGYHLAVGRYMTSSLIDNQMIQPLTRIKRLRIRIQRKSFTVETAMITSPDHIARNGILHVVDRVLLPPDLTLADMLQEGNYSGFVSALNQTVPNMLDLLRNETSTFTVFAPDDEALIELPAGMMERLLADETLLNKILGNHIIEEYVTVKGLKSRMYYQYETISSRMLTLRREDSDLITVGNLAIIKKEDIMTKNGVLHCISRLIQF